MNNRRNYYRILEVQPDAPFEVIRHNYRLLLHKLRMHPDLGGEQRDATLINIAFDTLRHPEKRAAYDKNLLQQNSITTLSQGHLTQNTFFSRLQKRSSTPAREQNQRNYYRILQVQPDAHAAIIRERYLKLLNTSDLPDDLLHEAYVVLNNAQTRVEYDRLLKRYGHRKAVEKMQSGNDFRPFGNQSGTDRLPLPDQPFSAFNRETTEPQPSTADFQPLITQYCAFCKTPHAAFARTDPEKLCSVCSSPLFSSGEDTINTPKRSLDRTHQKGPIVFYTYWPSRGLLGHLFDISPRGLRFSTSIGLDIGQIIKIDSDRFKAVAEVVHSHSLDNQTDNGVRFRTVAFNSPTGNFIATSA